MNPSILASRAVVAEYIQRVVRPLVVIAIIVFVIGLLGSTYLVANVSAWWTILLLVIIAYGVLGSLAWLALRYTIGRIKPEQNTSQKAAVGSFVDSVEAIQDTMGLTRFGLLLRIVRDVTQRRTDNTVTKFVGDSKKLQESFAAVVASFQSRS